MARGAVGVTGVQAAPPGWRDVVRGADAPRFAVLTAGVALHAVSIYVVATIMPVVVADIGGLAFFAWTATLYIAASLTGAAAVPSLLARVGARRAYGAAFGVFLAGSLACSIAPNMAALLGGRALQGFGGGMLPALAYGTIRGMVAPALHARAIALMGSVWGIAALLGPAVGGVVAQWGAWRPAFWLDLVIGAAAGLLAWRVVPAGLAEGVAARPFQGVRLGLLALAAVAVSAGGVAGVALPAALGIAAAAALVALVLRLDARGAARLLPGGAYNPARPLGAVSAAMGLLIMSTSSGTFVPYLAGARLGAAPIVGGYAAASLALAWTVASLLASAQSARGARASIAAGPALMLAGVAGLAWALWSGSLAGVFVAQAVVGTGIGIAWPHLGAAMMAVAPPADREIAGPFITTTQTLAAAFGSALAGMLANLAGLPHAATPAALGTVAAWLYGVSAIVPALACVMATQALRLTRPARGG